MMKMLEVNVEVGFQITSEKIFYKIFENTKYANAFDVTLNGYERNFVLTFKKIRSQNEAERIVQFMIDNLPNPLTASKDPNGRIHESIFDHGERVVYSTYLFIPYEKY